MDVRPRAPVIFSFGGPPPRRLPPPPLKGNDDVGVVADSMTDALHSSTSACGTRGRPVETWACGASHDHPWGPENLVARAAARMMA